MFNWNVCDFTISLMSSKYILQICQFNCGQHLGIVPLTGITEQLLAHDCLQQFQALQRSVLQRTGKEVAAVWNLRVRPASRKHGVQQFVEKLVAVQNSVWHSEAIHEIIAAGRKHHDILRHGDRTHRRDRGLLQQLLQV